VDKKDDKEVFEANDLGYMEMMMYMFIVTAMSFNRKMSVYNMLMLDKEPML